MPIFQLELTIVPETGLSVGGSGSTGVRADKTIQRDGRERPIIPASQIKGRLRHACEAILRGAGVAICRPPNPETSCPQDQDVQDPPCPICAIFGSPWTASPLQFRDLIHQPAGESSVIRPGTGIDRRRGIVKEELLFLTETTAPGTAPAFRSDGATISGTLADEGQALLLLTGLRSIRSWGGGKSRGMGWAAVDTAAHFDERDITLDDRGKEVLAQWLRQLTAS